MPKRKAKPQTQFITDLLEFITKHPHYKSQDGTLTYNADNDNYTLEIHDENGDYERTQITIQLIS